MALNLIDESGENWAIHSLSVLKRNALARILYFQDLYQKILDVPGVVCEFGVHWGAGISTLVNLRALYEPYNQSRIVYGFDTFAGFKGIDPKDGSMPAEGDFSVKQNYKDCLDQILSYHESICPFPDRKKYELIEGDACKTVDNWLEKTPHAVISLAIFDMDLYKPTIEVLSKINERFVKGSIVVFDEFNCSLFPGETEAVKEFFGLQNLRFKRHLLQPYCAYFEVE